MRRCATAQRFGAGGTRALRRGVGTAVVLWRLRQKAVQPCRRAERRQTERTERMAEDIKILVTGASGFIGSFICAEAERLGMRVWAGLRKGSSRRWLQSERLNVQLLDLTDRSVLGQQLQAFKEKYGRWDYVVHAAGATKCLHQADFDRNNYDCTVNLVTCLRELDMMPRLLLYVSSLSVLGAIREPGDGCARDVYAPLSAADEPRPNTAYGRSKVKSEQWLQANAADVPYVIFRPTGVYGPRERDYFLQVKSVRQHVDFAVGFTPQKITFVYVQDVVGALFAAIAKEREGARGRILHHIYHLSDGRLYTSRDFGRLVQQELGVRHVCRITAPLWVLKCVCAVGELAGRLTHSISALNLDKYHILRQRNWNCDIEPLREELGYEPQWPLERGVKETVAWYRQQGWL
jgi:UDP-glucose 4-epimerase